jgi:hypothetical protein
VFVPGNPCQPSLVSKLLALLANIKLIRKGFPGTNIRTYYKHWYQALVGMCDSEKHTSLPRFQLVAAVKSFEVQAPDF